MGLRSYLVEFVLVLLAFFYWGDLQLLAETAESRATEPPNISVKTIVQLDSPDLVRVPGTKDTAEKLPELLERNQQVAAGKIEATIINPFRSAAIAAEVSGIIERYNFEVGDRVREGEIILEISRKRYALAAQKARQSLDALQLALRRAKKDKEIKDKLVSMDASSQQELLRAEAEFEITEARVREAETSVQQTLLDLEACQVKAPFTGQRKFHLALTKNSPLVAGQEEGRGHTNLPSRLHLPRMGSMSAGH